jgi:hypothetical protein
MKQILLFLITCLCFAEWDVLDSLAMKTRIPAGSFVAVHCDVSGETLLVSEPPDSLTSLATLAVEKAPCWLQHDLTDNLNNLDSAMQNQYAQMIIDAQNPYIDEIAFQIAHIPYNILNQAGFYHDMIIENVQSLYQIDDFIDYAMIVDYGVGGVDSNYYSTVRYRTLNGVRDTIDVELSQEYYYWYILHPKISRELCSYIDPNTGDPAAPPTGKFWRDYIFFHADSGYPYLQDYVMNIPILWGGLPDDTTYANGAIAALNNWMRQVLSFESPGIRKYQPVQIYHEHRGTCTEWSILTSAAARASFIPTVRTSAYGNNHHWNEFFERRWIQWEPVNKMIDNYAYDPNWWELAAAINWRGDGYTWKATEQYTPHCTLTVEVIDSVQHPIDGARVAVRGGPQLVTWYCAFDYTNSSGTCTFLLGDLLNYDCQITSSCGSTPFTQVITNSQPGMHYYWFFQLNGAVPILPAIDDTFPSNPEDDYEVEITLSVPEEVIYGNNPDDNSAFACKDSTGFLEFFICSPDNYDRFLADSQFYGFLISKHISEIDTSFVFPWNDSWYIVITNKEEIAAAQEISVDVTLLKNPLYVSETKAYAPEITRFSVQPNPFKDKVTIRFDFGHRAQHIGLKIYDIVGRFVKQFSLPTAYSLVPTVIYWDGRDNAGTQLPNGVYFLECTVQYSNTSEAYRDVKKLILQREE